MFSFIAQHLVRVTWRNLPPAGLPACSVAGALQNRAAQPGNTALYQAPAYRAVLEEFELQITSRHPAAACRACFGAAYWARPLKYKLATNYSAPPFPPCHGTPGCRGPSAATHKEMAWHTVSMGRPLPVQQADLKSRPGCGRPSLPLPHAPRSTQHAARGELPSHSGAERTTTPQLSAPCRPACCGSPAAGRRRCR